MISILCPTRARPEGLERMWRSACDTASGDIELVVYVDHDDYITLNLLETEVLNNIGKNIVAIKSNPDKKEIYSNLHNICCHSASHDIVMGCADDVIFRTDNWDKRVLEEFDKIEDKIAYVYPDDGRHGKSLGTHGFFHKNWFNCLGYLSPPIFSVDFSDNYVMNLCVAINRAMYMEDVLVEHMHWTFGKSEFDETAKEAHRRRQSDDNAWQFANSTDRQISDIQKLKGVMNDTGI